MSWRFPPEFLRAVRDATQAALVDEADGIMAKAKPLTPIDKGPLAESGDVLPPEWDGETCTVTAGFGTTPETAEYAVVQHERTDYKHAPGKQSHYLAEPANEALSGMEERIAARVAKAL